MTYDKYFDEDDQSEIEDLFMGRKVVAVGDNNHLILDNGTVVQVIGNDGGCSCGAGDYDVKSLATTDNIITKVEFDYDPGGDDLDGEGYYRIYVYADNVKINLVDIEGSDGNGYYGTGYSLHVKLPKS